MPEEVRAKLRGLRLKMAGKEKSTMKSRRWTRVNPRMRERMRVIVKLGARRDRILESPTLDLEALERLVEDYEAAEMVCAAAALRRRLEWYRGEVMRDWELRILDFQIEDRRLGE